MLKLLLIVVILVNYTAGQGVLSRLADYCDDYECPARNRTSADEAGRRCRKECDPEEKISKKNMCARGLRCLCGRECGFSCIRDNKYCNAPPPIPHMARVEVYRKNTTCNDPDDAGSCCNIVPATGPNYEFDDQALYVCEAGYTLYKPNLKNYCTGRSAWSNLDNTKCVRNCLQRDEEEAEDYGVTCRPSCLRDQDCAEGEQCLCDDVCGRSCINLDVDCGLATPASNASIEYSGEGFGRIAHYSCNEGYFFTSGSLSRRCSGNGTWKQEPLIECARVQCQDPNPSIRDMGGYIVNWSRRPYYFGHQFTFECGSLQQLRGARNRTCLANGRWSGIPTTCDNIDIGQTVRRCPHPGIPVGGNLVHHENFVVDTWVEFRCNDHLVMIGKRRQLCLKFLQWSDGGAPSCIDPRIRDSSATSVSRLLQSTQELQSDVQLNVGRFINRNFEAGHEIYFLIDVSSSIKTEPQLNATLTFAVNLVKRLEANATGTIIYAITIFASEPAVIINIIDEESDPNVVIQELRNIQLNRNDLQVQTKSGTHTSEALRFIERQLDFSYARDVQQGRQESPQRHVFIMTDGKHTEGQEPGQIIRRITSREGEIPTFYSISACTDECARQRLAEDTYNELLQLANNKIENLIIIKDFYSINQLLDNVTSAQIDYSPCGQAGDVGSVKLQATVLAQVGRVVGGVTANSRAWPWQVLISQYNERSGGWPRSFYAYNPNGRFAFFRGGGSLINNQWVLTAAHLFPLPRARTWQTDYLLTFGMHRRPTNFTFHRLTGQIRVYTTSKIILHENYDQDRIRGAYDYDIALVKIGYELTEDFTTGDLHPDYANNGSISYTSYIRPVCLPCMGSPCMAEFLMAQGNFNESDTQEERCRKEVEALFQNGTNDRIVAAVTGFGHEGNRTVLEVGQQIVPSVNLQQILLEIRTPDDCRRFADVDIPWPFMNLRERYTDRMICANSADPEITATSCQGDSGGPMVREMAIQTAEKRSSCWMQIGIVSWGYGCGQYVRINGILRPIPGYYTFVPSFTSWINRTLNDN